VGTTVAQKLVDANVAAVVGHLNSGVTIPASEIYAEAGIPVISGSATNPMLTERGLNSVFRTVGRDDQQGPAIAPTSPTSSRARESPSSTIRPLRRRHRERGRDGAQGRKVSIVGRERTTDRETDFKAILTKIKAKNPDVIFHGGMDATGGPMLKQARELGIKATFAFGDGACTDQWQARRQRRRRAWICSQAGLPREAASPSS
jgi:branched-chain amino acid transport system substrate-binding protein